MISNIDQLKNFIIWCKSNKIKKMDIGDIKFEISELDFISEEGKSLNIQNSNLGKYNTETLTDTIDDNMDPSEDPDLYWSTNS